MKKILLNAYINLNFGDDLFLKILFERYPNVTWVLPKGGDTYKEVFKNYNNVIIKNDIFFKVKNKLRITEKNSIFNRYDAGLYIGGSIFMQIPEWKEQYKRREKVINSFARQNKPYFILGSNFGPYEDKIFKQKYELLLNKCKDICFRDKNSYNLFKKNCNTRLAPDIVFQLETGNVNKISNTIGISMIELDNRENLKEYKSIYLEKIKNIVEKGIEEGKKITFFSFCEEQGDLKIINELVEMMNIQYKKYISIVNYTGNIDEFLIEFSKMENIIGTRFHACILSQVFQQGLYPIIYSDKTYNVLKDIGLDNEYTYIKDLINIDEDNVLNIISKNKLNNLFIFEEAQKQFEELDKYVSKSE